MGGPHNDPTLTTSEPHIKVLKSIILISGISGLIAAPFIIGSLSFYFSQTNQAYFNLGGILLSGMMYALVAFASILFILAILMLSFGYRAKQFLTLTLFSLIFSFLTAALSIIVTIQFNNSSCNAIYQNLVINISEKWVDRRNDKDMVSFFDKFDFDYDMNISSLPLKITEIVDKDTCRNFFPIVVTSSVLWLIYTAFNIVLMGYVRVYPNKIGVYTDCCIKSSNVFGVDYYYGGSK